MSGDKILIDTNIVIYHLNGDSTIEALLENKNVFISFITEIELRSQKVSSQSERVIDKFISYSTVIHSNNQISLEASRLRRVKSIKIPDAIIASTAIATGIPLLSADKVFPGISGLEVIEYTPSAL
jgi:predicted nucleic acid-binding protein